MTRLTLWMGLLAGVLAAQTTEPSADYVYPSGTNAPLNTKVLVRGQCCSYDNNTVTVRNGSLPVAGTMQAANLGGQYRWFVFTPSQAFQPRTTYTVTVNVPYRLPATFTFTTGMETDTTPPQLVSTTPADGADGAFALNPVAIRFSEPINPVSLGQAQPSLKVVGSESPIYGGNWAMSDGSTITTALTSPLGLGTAYRVYFPGAPPEDMAGNRLAGPTPDFVFTTYPETPKGGPRLTGAVPAEGESGVATNSAIFLLFDRPMVLPAANAFSLGSSGDPQVAVRVEDGDGSGGIIVRPQILLRANQEYTLAADRLYDEFGNQYSGMLVKFRTGALPDSRAFQVVTQPTSVMPLVKRLQWQFSKPINPLLLPWLVRVDQGPGPTPPAARLLEDGMTVEADVPGPGRYVLGGKALDRVTEQGAGFMQSVLVTSTPDDRPPAPLALFPEGGSGAPPSALVRVAYDKSIAPVNAGDVVLWRGDEKVAADVSVTFATLEIKPRQSLTPGDYRADVRGVRGYAGNAAPDLSWTFRIDSATTAGAFQVESVEPTDGSQGVDPRKSLVIRFNQPPNAVQLPVFATVGATGSTVSGKWRVQENDAVFEPDGGFPPNTRVSWSVLSTLDFYLTRVATAGSSGGFWTGPAADTGPFRVLSISPAAGDTGAAGDTAITIQFNQAANGTTVTAKNLAVLSDGVAVLPITVSYDTRNRRATIGIDRFRTGTFQVIAGAGILSQSGVPLEPFAGEARLGLDPMSYSYATSRQVGPFLTWAGTINNGVVYVGHSIVLAFTDPMPHDLVERALVVIVNGARATGRIEWTPDSRGLTFTPDTPFKANTSGTVLLSLVPWGGKGVESRKFDVSDYYVNNNVVRSNAEMGPLPYDSIVDIAYDRDRPANYIQSATAESNGDPRKAFTLEVKAVSARTFRLRPPSPFLPSQYYTITLKTADGEEKRSLATRANFTPTTRQLNVGPTAEMGEAPVNVVLWVQARTPLNPIPFRAELLLDGAPVPFRTEFLDVGYLVLLRPYGGFLRGNSTYKVTLTGLEDSAGRPLPDRSWAFRTGAGPDITQAKIVSSSPSGVAPASSVLRVTFDKPVYFRRSQDGYSRFAENDFTVNTASGQITGAISFSPDGRTLSFVPDRPYPLNTPISTNITGFFYFDWIGGGVTDPRNSPPAFTTASTTGEALPVIDARNPCRDATGVPLNVQIQARFAEPVLPGSLGQVRLESDAGPVGARVIAEADGRTITLRPDRLEPDRTYTVVVEGVQNGAEAAAETADRWSFRTSGAVVGDSVAATAAVLSLNPLSIRVDAPRPVNAVSVTGGSFSLQSRGLATAVGARVDTDARAILVEPVVPVAAESPCYMNGTMRDWAGNSLSVTASCAPAVLDTTPPRVESLLPRPGTTLKWAEAAAVAMDEPILLRYGTDGIRVTVNGTVVPASVGLLVSGFAIRPANGWPPGGDCEIEVRGLVDRSGNEAEPVRWSFTISPDAAYEDVTLRMLSSTPANGAVGVPPETPVELRFSKPVTPPVSQTYASMAIVDAFRANTHVTLTERYRASYVDSSVRLVGPPLPPGATINLSVPAGDQSGRQVSPLLRFDTEAAADTTPPRIESITPAPGTNLSPGWTDFVVRFSEPVIVTGRALRFQTGTGSYGSEIRVGGEGDGRTLVYVVDVPAKATATLELLPGGISDLAGNPVEGVSYEYTSGEDTRFLKVVSMKPSPAAVVPLDAPIELTFNQPVPEASLASALSVWNDGVSVPVSLAAGAEMKVYRVTPSTPWKEKSTVAVSIGTNLYSTTGVLLSDGFQAMFKTVATTVNNTASNAVAGVMATAEAVDVRFAEPREVTGEPFGIRRGQERVPARVERLGAAWFRLVPDEPLDASGGYVLMAGDGAEFPLRVKAELTDDEPAEAEAVDGAVRLRLGRSMHPFGAPSVAVVDEAGQAMPHSTTVVDGGRAVRIEVYGPGAPGRVVWSGRTVGVRARPLRP